MKVQQAIPRYGRNLLSNLEPVYFQNFVVFCAPEPWEMVRRLFAYPKEVVIPNTMEQSDLETKIDLMPQADVVFGIGGGSACDAAKMYAWKTGARLVLVPTILSVDAPFTKAVGVRVDHRVRYVGEVFPEHLLVDFDLLQQAPAKLNRAGIGDVLSIFTALYDWRLAHEQIGESYDENVAAQSQALLDRLIAGSDDIRDCTDEGLKLISELYVGEVALCEQFGNSRPEEGSEHYFAYCLESITQKHYIHGELVALGVLLGGLYQDQDITPILDFLDAVQVAYQPDDVGISEDEIRQALLALPQYLEEEKQLPYGIYHHKGVTADQAGELLKKLGHVIGQPGMR